MTAAVVIVGLAWTGAAVVGAALVRRPGEVLDRAAARRAWQAAHGLERPLQDTSRLISGYVAGVQAVARPLARAGCSPHALTLLAVGPALVAAALVGLGGGWSMVGGLLVLAAGLLDGVDGAVAVLQGRTTSFGRVLDSTTDRVVDVVVLGGPCLWASRRAAAGTASVTVSLAVAAGFSILLMEYVRARSQIAEPSVTRITPGERPTRVILGGLGGIGR